MYAANRVPGRHKTGVRVSDSDSFINEVTDEMRREKLFGYLRRYGWIAVVVVLGIVGGTAWNEFRSAQSRTAAEAAGDALLTALAVNDPAARAAAIADVSASGNAAVITAMLTAATQEEAEDYAAAATTLGELASRSDVPAIYRDLAAIKSAMLPVGDVPTRLAGLEALAQAGQPFRLLALEQIAYLTLETGDAAAAITVLRQIEEDAAVTRGLRERAQTLIIALGEEPAAPTQLQ